MGFVRGAQGGMSEDGSRLFVPHRRGNDLVVDVWGTTLLRYERELSFAAMGGFYHDATQLEPQRKLLEAASLVAPDRLALCLGDGRLIIVSIPDGQILVEQNLGGTGASAICASSRYVAVSVFPDGSAAANTLAGVRVYDRAALLEAGRLELQAFYASEDLPCLPQILRYDKDECALLALGSIGPDRERVTSHVLALMMQGYAVESLLQEDGSESSCGLSNIADDGSYAVIGQREVLWFSSDHTLQWRCPRPSLAWGECPHSILTLDGHHLWIQCGGKVAIVTRGANRVRELLALGNVTPLGAYGEQVYAQVLEPSSYRVVAFDAAGLRMVSNTAPKEGIQPVHPHAFDVSSFGKLCVGDADSCFREFDHTLRLESIVPTGRGPVSQVLVEPCLDRVCALTAGGAVLVHLLGTQDTEIYAKCAYHRMADTGAHLNWALVLSGRGDYPLMFSPPDGRVRVHAGKQRNTDALCSDGRWEVRLEDYDWQWEGRYADRGRYPIESRACAITLLRGFVVLALDNHKLVVFDAMSIDQHGDEAVLLKPGPHCIHLALASAEVPVSGMCIAGDDRLVLWSTYGVSVLTISDQWEITAVRQVERPGVKNIRWDSRNNRLILAHDHHLSVCTMEVAEIARLYLLPRGRQLIHVPYPEDLCTGLKQNHPGYYWIDGDDDGAPLLEVTDRQGRVIADHVLREEFLGQYRSEFMVRQALGNYSRFIKTLEKTAGQNVSGARHALLPQSNRI